MARYRGAGTQLWVDTSETATPDFEKVKQCYAGQLGGSTTAQIDVTDFDSAAREFIAGMTEEGQASFSIFFDPNDDVHEFLRTSRQAGTSFDVEVRLTQAATPVKYAFEATVDSSDLDFGSAEGAMQMPLTLKISGAVTKSPIGGG